MYTHNEEERNYYMHDMYDMHNKMNDMNFHNMNMNMDMEKFYMNHSQSYSNMPSRLFDPMKGLFHGNLFPELYQGYRDMKVYKVEPVNEQAKLLLEVDALQFAMKEINLYLDIYNNDREMINLYDQYKQQWMHAVKQYEEKFGPILITSPTLKNDWSWSKQPWPWEV